MGHPPVPIMTRSARLRKRLALLGALGLVLWVAFFDSHSLWRRASYARELGRVTEENERLEAENEALDRQIAEGLDAETVEKTARELYGMRRPGERVYRVDAPANE